MPRQSFHSSALATMWRTLNRSTALLPVNYVIDGSGENLDMENPTLVSYLPARSQFHTTSGRCYCKTWKFRKLVLHNNFDDDLWVCEEDMHWMNHVEFKRKFRCSCPHLIKLFRRLRQIKYFFPRCQ